jgi:hypothetical protein
VLGALRANKVEKLKKKLKWVQKMADADQEEVNAIEEQLERGYKELLQYTTKNQEGGEDEQEEDEE